MYAPKAAALQPGIDPPVHLPFLIAVQHALEALEVLVPAARLSRCFENQFSSRNPPFFAFWRVVDGPITEVSPGRGIEGRDGELESIRYWHELLHATAVEHGVFIFYAGLAGFEGGKGMTGSSRVVDPRGATLAEAPALGTCIIRADIDFGEVDLARASLPLLGDLGAVLPDLLLDDELLPSLAHERRP